MVGPYMPRGTSTLTPRQRIQAGAGVVHGTMNRMAPLGLQTRRIEYASPHPYSVAWMLLSHRILGRENVVETQSSPHPGDIAGTRGLDFGRLSGSYPEKGPKVILSAAGECCRHQWQVTFRQVSEDPAIVSFAFRICPNVNWWHFYQSGACHACIQTLRQLQ